MGNLAGNASFLRTILIQNNKFEITIIAMRLFAVLLVCLAAAGPLRAQEELLPAPVLDGIYAGLEPKPAREILTVEDFEEYSRLLAERECIEGLVILLETFGAVYPDRPAPLSSSWFVFNWYSDIGQLYYPEFFFCLNVREIREGQAQIFQDNIAADRFESRQIGDNLPDPVRRRNFGVFSLLEQTKQNYPPAFLEMARLSAEGEIVRFSAVYQYYLLLRARELGMQSDELDRLLSATKWRLTPFEIASFESADYRKQLAEGEPIYE